MKGDMGVVDSKLGFERVVWRSFSVSARVLRSSDAKRSSQGISRTLFFFFNENMTGFGSRTGMENGKSRKTKITRQELADG